MAEVRVRPKRGLEEIERKVKEHRLWERYLRGEDIEVLAAEVGISKRQLFNWFKALNLKAKVEPEQIISTKVQMQIADNAVKDAEIAMKIGGTIAVSYTHLTLPTICSV